MQSPDTKLEARVNVCFQENGDTPFIHASCDGQPWQTVRMSYSHKRIYHTVLRFSTHVKFVLCNESKTQWYNPCRELSRPGTFIVWNSSANFLIQDPGDYYIVNCVLSKCDMESGSTQDSIVAVNVDGVLLGDDLSLMHFNDFWMKMSLANRNLVLVYLTGRPLKDLLSVKAIVHPDFVVVEGGSAVYEMVNQQGKSEYSLAYENRLSSAAEQELLQLQAHGFTKVDPKRQNSYCIGKRQLIKNNLQICGVLGTLESQYNMVEQTETVYFDFTGKGTNKLEGLNYIKERTGIDRCIGFGSNLNDYQLLMACDLSAVPTNASRRLLDLLDSQDKQYVRGQGQFAQVLIQVLQSTQIQNAKS